MRLKVATMLQSSALMPVMLSSLSLPGSALSVVVVRVDWSVDPVWCMVAVLGLWHHHQWQQLCGHCHHHHHSCQLLCVGVHSFGAVLHNQLSSRMQGQGWRGEHPNGHHCVQSCCRCQWGWQVGSSHGCCCGHCQHALDGLYNFVHGEMYCMDSQSRGMCWTWIQSKALTPWCSTGWMEGSWVDRCWAVMAARTIMVGSRHISTSMWSSIGFSTRCGFLPNCLMLPKLYFKIKQSNLPSSSKWDQWT